MPLLVIYQGQSVHTLISSLPKSSLIIRAIYRLSHCISISGKQGPASCTAYLWQVARDKGARGFSDRTTENEWMRRRIMRYLGFGFSPKRPKTQQAQHACFPLSPIFQSPHPLFAGLFSGQLLSSIKTPNLESDGCK